MNFQYRVAVAVDPKCKTTYSHKFPVIVGNQVRERWSRKPLPPKNITSFLRGMGLRRYRDYQVTVDTAPQAHGMVYHFIDDQDAMMLRLFAGVERTHTDQHHATCPQCGTQFRL